MPYKLSYIKKEIPYQLCKNDAVGRVGVLFLHYDLRFSAAFLIGSTDSQCIHAVFEHPAADSKQVGGMGLDIAGSFQGIQDNLALEFHHGFLE